MSAVLTSTVSLGAAASASGPDAGLLAAVIVSAGVTALVAVGMTFIAMHRSARLTVTRVLAAAGLGLGIIGIAVGGVLAVSPTAAQATPDQVAPYVLHSSQDDLDLQLPTLSED